MVPRRRAPRTASPELVSRRPQLGTNTTSTWTFLRLSRSLIFAKRFARSIAVEVVDCIPAQVASERMAVQDTRLTGGSAGTRASERGSVNRKPEELSEADLAHDKGYYHSYFSANAPAATTTVHNKELTYLSVKPPSRGKGWTDTTNGGRALSRNRKTHFLFSRLQSYSLQSDPRGCC